MREKKVTLHSMLLNMPIGNETNEFRKNARDSAIANLKTKVKWSLNMQRAVATINNAAFVFIPESNSFEIDIPFLQDYINAAHLGGGLYLFIE